MATNLQVQNNISSTAQYVQDASSNNSSLAVSSDKIGIGTSSPSSKLTVYDTGAKLTINGISGGSGDDTKAMLNLRIDTSNLWQVGTDNGASGLSQNQFFIRCLDGDAYKYLVIQQSGNVGVGVTSPGEKLEVNGAVKMDEATSIGDPGADKASIYSAERSGTGAAGTGLFARMPDKGSTSDIRNIAAVDWFNVKDYGATGNGSANDRDAIQAAIDAANTAGGGIVYLPAGNYRICSKLHMHSYVSLIGAGVDITKIAPSVGFSSDNTGSSGKTTVSSDNS